MNTILAGTLSFLWVLGGCAAQDALAESLQPSDIAIKDWAKVRMQAAECMEKGETKRAESLYSNALQATNQLGPKSLYRAISLRELAALLSKSGRPSVAITLLLEENELISEVPDSPMTIDNMSLLVRSYALLGDEKSAMLWMNRLKSVKNFREDLVMIAADDIEKMYVRAKRFDKATAWLEQVEREVASSVGEQTQRFLECENSIGSLQEQSGHSQEALRIFLSVIDKCLTAPELHFQTLEQALTSACTMYHRSKQDERAICLYKKVLFAQDNNLSAEHRKFLFRRIFDTLVWFGEGDQRLIDASVIADMVTSEANNATSASAKRVLLGEACYEKAVLNIISANPSTRTILSLANDIQSTQDLRILVRVCPSYNKTKLQAALKQLAKRYNSGADR